jgi:hypothetical protein
MSDKDFLDELQEEARLRYKRPLTPSEAAEKFALHGFEARIAHLKRLKTPIAMTLRETAERHAFESAIRRVHSTLQKVGR